MANGENGVAERAASETASKPYILLIEDSALTRKMYRSALMTAGFDVGEATGVAAALKAVAQRKPEVMVIDMFLEEGTGVDLAHAIKKDERNADIILVSVSSAQSVGHQGEIKAAPFDARLKKPVKIAELVAEVGRLCERRKAALLERLSETARPTAMAIAAAAPSSNRIQAVPY